MSCSCKIEEIDDEPVGDNQTVKPVRESVHVHCELKDDFDDEKAFETETETVTFSDESDEDEPDNEEEDEEDEDDEIKNSESETEEEDEDADDDISETDDKESNPDFWEFVERAMQLLRRFFPALSAIQRKELCEVMWNEAALQEDVNKSLMV